MNKEKIYIAPDFDILVFEISSVITASEFGWEEGEEVENAASLFWWQE